MSLTKKQEEYLQHCNRRWNIKTGATGSGKSWLDYAYVIPARIMATRGEGLIIILGATQATVIRNIIEPMLSIYGARYIGNIHADNSVYMFGKKCYVMGAGDSSAVTKIQGSTIEYAYGDEVATWARSVFEMLKSRLRCKHSHFDGTCNPEGPDHWFKSFLDSDADIYRQNYIIDDNPNLPEEFVKSLKREYAGTVYYDRYILGKWALAEGLVFPRYTEAFGNAPEGSQYTDFSVSVDYGTQNPFGAILWGKVGNVWYGLKEYYWNGRDKGIQKTDEEYAKDMEKFVEPIVANYDGTRKLEMIIDPSAASFIALMKKKSWCKPRKAKNAVLDGIRATNSAMHEGLIKINPDMKNWRHEAGGYVWDDKSGEDKPVKERDHLMDATRYFVMTKHIVRKKRNADLSGLIRG